MSLRANSLSALQIHSPAEKCASTIALLCVESEVSAGDVFPEPDHLPCRPDRPTLVSVLKVQKRSAHTVEGRAALIHALAHIELNAIDLGLDIVWRFPDMPKQKWLRLSEQLSPIYKWTEGGLLKVQSCPRRRASLATNAEPRWATRGAPEMSF